MQIESLRACFANAPLATLVIRQGTLEPVIVNHALQALCGGALCEGRSFRPEDLVDARDLARLQRCIDGAMPRAVVRWHTRDGLVACDLDVQRFDAQQGAALLALHLRPSGSAEALAMEEHERLRTALETSGIGVWDWNVVTGEVVFDRRWAEMLGYDLDEIEPNLSSWERLVHPEDMPVVMRALQPHLDGAIDEYHCVHRMRHKAGHWLWVKDRGRVVLRDAQQRPLRAVGTHVNVTAEKRMQAELQAEHALFASGPVIVFKWRNVEGWPVDHVSANVEEQLGFAPQRFLSGDLPYASLVHPQDRDRVAREVAEAAAVVGEDFFTHEPYRLRNSAGDYIHVLDQTRILRDEAGNITHYHGYLVDITQRLQAVHELDFVNVLVNTSRDPVYAVSTDDGYRMVFINDAGLRHYGRPRHEILQMRVPDWDTRVSTEDVDRLIERVRRSREAVVFETEHLRGDGTAVLVEVSVSLIVHQGREYAVGYIQDITARRQQEQRLRASEARLKAIFDNSNVGIMQVSGNRVLTKGNQRLADILGYESPGRMIGLSMRSLHADERCFHDFGEHYYTTLRDQSVFQVELQLRRRDGSLVWCSVSGKALDDHQPADLGRGVIWVIDDIERRKRYEQELIGKQAQIRALFDNIPYLAWMKDADGRFMMVNRPMAGSAGRDEAEMIGLSDFDIWPAELAQTYVDDDRAVIRSGRQLQREETLDTADGQIWVETFKSPIFDADGALLGTVGLARDITERIQTQEALRLAEEQARLLLEHSNEGIFGLDNEGVTTFVNPAAARMLGYPAEELIGRCNHNLIHHSLADGSQLPACRCRMTQAAREARDFHVADEVLWRKDGSSFPVEYWSTPIYRDGAVVGSVVTFHDITERQKAEERVRRLAYHDSLTDLPNRRLFLHNLRAEIENAQRFGHRFAVLMIDLDHFKEVNDTLGHPIGDRLLRAVAGRLRGKVRKSDTFARLGGDEFIILLPNLHDESEAAVLGGHIIQMLDEPFHIDDRDIMTGASIGIVVCDRHDDEADRIISRCDVALYRAKERGRGNFVFYERAMTERVAREAELAQLLSRAIDNDELRLVLQPKIALDRRCHQGFEALLRWRSPVLGEVSPASFIPVAEKRGMINRIGLWVGHEVARVQEMLRSGGIVPGRIALNLSQIQLNDPAQLRSLANALCERGAHLSDFEVEITETAYAEVTPDSLAELDALHREGLVIAIDDFGTGYSSMVSLRKLKAFCLKIDYDFVRDMTSDDNDRVIVEATIRLAHSLGMTVVAEGVEHEEQAIALTSMGCNLAQGFLFARPLEIDAVPGYLSATSAESDSDC